MPFLMLCIIIAMVVQLLVLFNLQEHHIKFRYISFFLMEIFPLGGALMLLCVYGWLVQFYLDICWHGEFTY